MVQIKWNMAGFRALRFHPNVAADIDARGRAIAEACGPGYVHSPYEGRNRHRCSVITATGEAIRDNAKNNTLLRNLDAGA
ncbi:MAG: hypothetical protein WAN89_02760 [Lawsonella sp.]